YCFFFQAEDGIRDFHVTGVQTCALPIFGGSVTHDPPHLDVGRTTPFLSAIAPARRACGTHGGSVTRDPPYGCEPVSGAIPRIRGVENTFPAGHGPPRGVRGGSRPRAPPAGCEPL